MQAIPSFSPPQSLQHFSDDHFQFSTVDKVSDDLTAQLQLTPDDDNTTQKSSQFEEQEDENEQGEEEEHDEDEFSFITSSDKSAISADDVFHDGQIRPIFPLFNRDLLLSDYDYHSSSSEFPRSPMKVFVEAPPHPSSSSSETDKNDGVAEGPYCAWSKKPTEASPDSCKKSNSTGFSKLWRFKDYLDRSNSDGRDAFVFLNNSTVSAKREDKIAEKSEGSSKKKTAGEISSEKKPAGEVKVGGGKTGKVINKKGGVKGKTASLSAHEVYMRNRGSQEDDRRRSYLPYRPELVGFFTNVNGGLSRNVHPF